MHRKPRKFLWILGDSGTTGEFMFSSLKCCRFKAKRHDDTYYVPPEKDLIIASLYYLFGTDLILPARSHKTLLATLCLTPECISTASRMLMAMDRSVNPCEDFYQFSCGGWTKRTKLDDMAVAVSMIADDLRTNVRNDLIDLLSADPNPDDPAVFNQIKYFYESCMEADDIIEDSSSREYLRELLEKYGGYLTGTTGSDDLSKLMTFMINVHSIPFFQISLNFDAKNVSHMALEISPVQKDLRSKLGKQSHLPEKIPIQPEGQENEVVPPNDSHFHFSSDERLRNHRAASHQLLAHLLLALGYAVEDDGVEQNRFKKASKLLHDIFKAWFPWNFLQAQLSPSIEVTVDFSSSLLLSPSVKEHRRASLSMDVYNMYSVRQMETEFSMLPWFSWKTVLRELLIHDLSESDKIIVYFPQHLKRVAEELRQQDSSTIRDALLTHFLGNTIADHMIRRDKSMREIEEVCVEAVELIAPIALSGLYVRKTSFREIEHYRKEVIPAKEFKIEPLFHSAPHVLTKSALRVRRLPPLCVHQICIAEQSHAKKLAAFH
ncbi:unnamed protein product [Notodromas monacha]|uniref:Peptidase M13 N-terminal domain-containing protein n=1 Tax=Notodromas monacha TaxID=399045 RepID=A0A7R9BPR9_9CRUS|nr:unnamed protein product [Notodromas monacha]CAG0918064.1 unnamed protein product [Notodromas monacha]